MTFINNTFHDQWILDEPRIIHLQNVGNDVTCLYDKFINQTSNILSQLWGYSGSSLLEVGTIFDSVVSLDSTRFVEWGGFQQAIVKDIVL